MTTIRLHRHPFAGLEPQEFDAPSLAEWLLARYETGPRVGVQVFVGEPSGETEITHNPDALLRSDQPVYTVLESPGDPVTLLYNIAIAVVLQVVSTALFGAKKPPLANRAQESPNNQLSNRENQVRTLQRVEDIFGTVRSIPSLMMMPYSKYVQHRRVEYGYYCIGRGYYDVPSAEVCDADTPLEQITGSSAAVYEPFTSPNSGDAPQLQIGDAIIDLILTVNRSNSVDGITLKALNQIKIYLGSDYLFWGFGPGITGFFPTHTGDLIYQPIGTRIPNFLAVAEVGQQMTVSLAPFEALREDLQTFVVSAAAKTYTAQTAGYFLGTVIGSTCEVSGFLELGNNGTKTVTAVSANGRVLTVAEAVSNEEVDGVSFLVTVQYSGTRTISRVGDGWVELEGTQFSTDEYRLHNYVFPFVGEREADIEVLNDLSEWTDWFTLPDVDRTEVWANVLAPSGLYFDDGSKSRLEVEYELEIEQLTDLLAPTGIVEVATGSLSGATSDERAETLEHVTAWVGPARVRARRVTPFDYELGGLVVDEIKLADLYAVSPVGTDHFGNKTTIHTVTRATPRATSVRSRQLNCLASRKIPTFNGTTFSGAFDADGVHVSGTIEASSRIVDIIAAVTVDPVIGNRDIADVDMAQVWATQQALDAWNTECGQFNYTFDSDALSFEETVTSIADAAFCVAYRQNGKIRLALDRPQTVSTALFTHRNKKPNAESITRKFSSDSDYDGVELVYRDPETESEEAIRLPLDGLYTKLKKVEVTGIRSYEQAWLRANREYARLTHQRMTIETETTTDARSILPNSRVDIVDNTRFKSWDGEVVVQAGLTLTLSRDVEFVAGEPHSIVLMRRDGSLQSIAVTAGGAANKVLLASLPSEAIVTRASPDEGIRTTFSLAADSARGAMAWLVQEIGSSDGQYIRLRAVNYTDAYYAADELPIPDKTGVIYD